MWASSRDFWLGPGFHRTSHRRTEHNTRTKGKETRAYPPGALRPATTRTEARRAPRPEMSQKRQPEESSGGVGGGMGPPVPAESGAGSSSPPHRRGEPKRQRVPALREYAPPFRSLESSIGTPMVVFVWLVIWFGVSGGFASAQGDHGGDAEEQHRKVVHGYRAPHPKSGEAAYGTYLFFPFLTHVSWIHGSYAFRVHVWSVSPFILLGLGLSFVANMAFILIIHNSIPSFICIWCS
jgi:hypothetical protein